MSGVGEALTVIAVVAGLISAYKDGSQILEKIKDRRRAKNKLPPSELLENSLEQGQREIEAAQHTGEARLGDQFKNGDALAIQALQTVTIEVQSSMLRHLRDAVQDDDMNDFEACIDTTIDARLRAVNILNDLYLRQRNGTISELSRQTTGDSGIGMPKMHTIPEKRQARNPSSPDIVTEKPSKISKMFQKGRRSTSESSGTGTPPPSISSPEIKEVKDNGFFAPRRSRPDNRKLTVTYRENRGKPSDASSNSPRSSISSMPKFMSIVPSQDPGNLCEGAYYVQASTNIKGFELAKDRKYWKCRRTKCAFQGIARKDALGQLQYDDTARRSGPIRYRWLFQAKSHVVQSKSKNFISQFRCLVCRLEQNDQATRIYDGYDALFKHVVKHSGTVVSGVKLEGPICFRHDRICAGDEETFDVCFPAAEPGQMPDQDKFSFSRAPTAVELQDASINEAPERARPGPNDFEFNPW